MFKRVLIDSERQWMISYSKKTERLMITTPVCLPLPFSTAVIFDMSYFRRKIKQPTWKWKDKNNPKKKCKNCNEVEDPKCKECPFITK